MPRQRFSWQNLEHTLLEKLGSDLRLKGDPASALEKEYGSTPKVDFIKDAWPVLLDSWLANDYEACNGMAEALRSKGLGDTEIGSPLMYLKSCRNSQNLRETCIKLFLEKGKLRSLERADDETSYTRKEEELSTGDLRSAEEEDREKEIASSSELVGKRSKIDRESGATSHGKEAITDNSDPTACATEETSKLADKKPGENGEHATGSNGDGDQLDTAEINLAIAFLTPDVREGLKRLGHLDSQGEWISKDRSTEGLKRAIAMASQPTAPRDADLPNIPQSLVGGTRTIAPVSAPTIGKKRQAHKAEDETPQQVPRRKIRWGMHTGPLIIVGVLLAVTLSSGLIGFVLLLFFGLPIALYSLYKDLNDQAQRIQAKSMRASASTAAMSSTTQSISDKPNTTSSSQQWTEPPSFDYSYRNGKVPDTEEWGLANMRIIINYATDAAIYCLALKATQHGKGRGAKSAEVEVLWKSILFMAAEQDKEMAKCLQIAENSIKGLVFSKLIQDGLCRELSNGELELAAGIPEAEDVSFADTEYAEVEIDGIVFPLLTDLSPDQINYYCANRKEWIDKYPSAAENWPKIVTHSRLLAEKRVAASQTEAGPWLYTAAVDEGTDIHAQAEQEQPTNAGPPQSLTDKDRAILGMWNLVRPVEAVDLKFIVMDNEGRFAGEFTADDQHGDRYFTVTENSNGDWSLRSNLTSNDPDTLSKTAKAGLAQYREICAKATYRFETDSNDNSSKDIVSERTDVNAYGSQQDIALTGGDLIRRVKELGDIPPHSLAKACGYVTRLKGSEVGDTEAFYNALFHAHSSQNS